MGKILTSEEIQNLALEVARNKHFIERLDDYEKQAIKKETESEIWLYDQEVRIGMQNISEERKEKIKGYKLARKRLRMDEMLKGLKGIIENDEGNASEANLSQKQQALILIYNDEVLQGNAPTRLKNDFAKLNKPGSAGDRERRCMGEKKKTLRQRLIDFETIVPFIHSEPGIQKMNADRTAVEKEYENM
jgi:hypothetical protein